jgi:transposase
MTKPSFTDDELVAEVMRLHYVEGVGVRPIARRLGVARNTVRRILGRRPPKPTRGPVSRESVLDPFVPVVRQLLDDTPEMRAPAVLERLRPLGYTGGITILRDRMRRLRPRRDPEAFLTLEFAPASALQVDWADFGFAIPGCPRRVCAFVAALAYSRYFYLEFTLSQAMGTFLRCMERALRFFGGVTTTSIFDNMKTVVLEHTPVVTRFNPRFLDYARVRGAFETVACGVKKPHQKGRVERPIGFMRERFWPGRRFKDLLDLNRQAAEWRDNFANNRVHDETGRVPALVFEHEERRLLKPLTPTPFNVDDIEPSTVTKTFRVRFDRNKYSVPWRLVSQPVLIRADDEWVSVFLGPKKVALHRRSWDIGQDVEEQSHRRRLEELKPRARADALPPMLAALGETGISYFKITAGGSRSIHRETVRLTLLVELFGSAATASAMQEVMATGHVGAEYVEYILRHKRGLTPHAAPLRLGNPVLDGIILPEPDLSLYDRPALTRDPGEPPHAVSPADIALEQDDNPSAGDGRNA